MEMFREMPEIDLETIVELVKLIARRNRLNRGSPNFLSIEY